MKDLADDEGVQALIGQLDAEQTAIKHHLADHGQTVAQVLDDYEHFAIRIDEIDSEFEKVTSNREQKFLLYQETIHKTLKRILPSEPVAIPYNPRNDAGLYQKADEKVVEHLRRFL